MFEGEIANEIESERKRGREALANQHEEGRERKPNKIITFFQYGQQLEQ